MNQITPEMYEAVCQQRDEARAEVKRLTDGIKWAKNIANRGLAVMPNSKARQVALETAKFIEVFGTPE